MYFLLVHLGRYVFVGRVAILLPGQDDQELWLNPMMHPFPAFLRPAQHANFVRHVHMVSDTVSEDHRDITMYHLPRAMTFPDAGHKALSLA